MGQYTVIKVIVFVAVLAWVLFAAISLMVSGPSPLQQRIAEQRALHAKCAQYLNESDCLAADIDFDLKTNDCTWQYLTKYSEYGCRCNRETLCPDIGDFE